MIPHGLSGRKDTGYIVWEPLIGYCQEPKTVQAQTSKLHRCKLFTCQSSFVDGVQWVWFLSRQTFRMSEDAAIMKGICTVDEPRVQVSDFARERRHNGRISIQKPPWLLGASCHAVSVSDENRAVPWCFFSSNRTSMTMWDTSQGYWWQFLCWEKGQTSGQGLTIYKVFRVFFFFSSHCVQDDDFQQKRKSIQCIWGQYYRWLALQTGLEICLIYFLFIRQLNYYTLLFTLLL